MDNPFDKYTLELAETLAQKKASYGQSTNVSGDLLALLYPTGISPEQYGEAGLVVRMLDKLCRITLGGNRWFNEDAWKDLAGYAVIGWKQGKEREKGCN